MRLAVERFKVIDKAPVFIQHIKKECKESGSGMRTFVFLKLFLACCVSLSAGLVGALFMGNKDVSNWYEYLRKPFFTPPNWVFGPAWTALYILMGVAVFLVWQKGTANRYVKVALVLFAIQLVLNALWTPLFFRLHMIGLALVEIIILWIFVLATTVSFYGVSKLACVLFCPYLAWLSFAVALNGSIWWLNR